MAEISRILTKLIALKFTRPDGYSPHLTFPIDEIERDALVRLINKYVSSGL